MELRQITESHYYTILASIYFEGYTFVSLTSYAAAEAPPQTSFGAIYAAFSCPGLLLRLLGACATDMQRQSHASITQWSNSICLFNMLAWMIWCNVSSEASLVCHASNVDWACTTWMPTVLVATNCVSCCKFPRDTFAELLLATRAAQMSQMN